MSDGSIASEAVPDNLERCSEKSVEDTVDKGTPWYSSVLIIMNAAIGAGILNLPHAYHLAGGVAIAITFQAVLCVIAIGSLVILAYCADHGKTGTYQEILKVCCGETMHTICSLTLILYAFGSCIAFLIIIGDMWDKVFDYAVTDPVTRGSWFLDRRFFISITSFAVILPACFAKQIGFLRYGSGIGMLGVTYIVILIIVQYFSELPERGYIKTRPDSWSDVFYVLPAICFGYQCHISSVPVYAGLRGRPNLRLYAMVAGLALSTCFFTYCATGVFGYLSFGSHVSPDVLVDYPPTGQVMAGLALLAVNIYTSYPILHFCGRSSLATVTLHYSGWSDKEWNTIERRFRYSSTVIWYAVSLLLALFVPNIGSIIGILGSLAAFFIFIYPGLALLTLTLHENPKEISKKFKVIIAVSIFYVILGTFIFGLSLSQSIMHLIKTI
ncbi:unnamed protein product [Calicophoron daubneyi]|uniref:Amino acid transporter transmembrane domain-containing protein n=1 Tax=Calicophoron daubneyi TaxID=300641 RepID=A0AAV2TG04_CALDB